MKMKFRLHLCILQKIVFCSKQLCDHGQFIAKTINHCYSSCTSIGSETGLFSSLGFSDWKHHSPTLRRHEDFFLTESITLSGKHMRGK